MFINASIYRLISPNIELIQHDNEIFEIWYIRYEEMFMIEVKVSNKIFWKSSL